MSSGDWERWPRGSPKLPVAVVTAGLRLTAEALRTNESGIVAAAVGPFAAAYLDQHSWRHAVLKLVFMGVSLSAVTDLPERADDELARMARDFAAERTAAGRPVPADVQLLLQSSSGQSSSSFLHLFEGTQPCAFSIRTST